MFRRFIQEIRPRNGHTLIVLVVCRISGCARQKDVSLEDQEDNCKALMRELYDGPVEFVVISTRGKGERLDRAELAQIEKAMRSRRFDFALFDDLSRLIRGEYAKTLLGIGKDHGTRSISINDGIDTDDPTWEENAMAVCTENLANQTRASLRIKQKNMNRFKKTGGPTGRPIASYIVPENAKTYDDWRKDETATSIVREGREILLRAKRPNLATVVDYFVANCFAPGPYASSKKWSNDLVRDFYANPILKGWPQRGYRRTVKHNESGHRPSRKNPEGPTYYHAPHLAHLTEDEFDSLNAYLNAANADMGRKKVNGADPLAGLSRMNSQFPGLHANCWYCGFHYVWGANGQPENLMCRNSREWRCWHSIGFSGPELTSRLTQFICYELSRLDGFDSQFAELVARSGSCIRDQNVGKWDSLRRDEAKLVRDKENVQAAIRKAGAYDLLTEELEKIKCEEQRLLILRHHLEHSSRPSLELPDSIIVMRQLLQEQFRQLATDSAEFADLLRGLVPEIYVYSVRLCDGGHPFEDEEFRNTFREQLRRATNWDLGAEGKKDDELKKRHSQIRQQQDQLLNLRLLEEIEADTYAAKARELRDEEAELQIKIEAASRSHHETIDLAIRAFELSQDLRAKWFAADVAAKRRILEIIGLNWTLDDATLVPEWRKPFDQVAEGLQKKDSRGDRI